MVKVLSRHPAKKHSGEKIQAAENFNTKLPL